MEVGSEAAAARQKNKPKTKAVNFMRAFCPRGKGIQTDFDLRRWRNHDHKLSFQTPLLRDFQECRRFAAQKFLELLGQLARQHHVAVGKNFVQLAQQLFDAIRRFVENQSAFNRYQRFQFVAPLAGFVRQETDEMKFSRRQTARREPGNKRARTSHGLHAKSGGYGGAHHAFAGVADAGTAGVRDQRNFLAASETFDDLFAAFGLIELEIAQKRFGDAKMFQQLPGMTRVLDRKSTRLNS